MWMIFLLQLITEPPSCMLSYIAPNSLPLAGILGQHQFFILPKWVSQEGRFCFLLHIGTTKKTRRRTISSKPSIILGWSTLVFNICLLHKVSSSFVVVVRFWNTTNPWFLPMHFYCILYYGNVEKSFCYRPDFDILAFSLLFSISDTLVRFYMLYYVKY